MKDKQLKIEDENATSLDVLHPSDLKIRHFGRPTYVAISILGGIFGSSFLAIPLQFIVLGSRNRMRVIGLGYILGCSGAYQYWKRSELKRRESIFDAEKRFIKIIKQQNKINESEVTDY
ncbi:MAG: hypothetical protein MHMPM18_001110 [Marteilia pararefringens]